MTKIEYKPHCGKCGALINEGVMYRDIIVEDKSIRDYSYLNGGAVIEPYRCSCCGAIFNQIEIRTPKKDREIRIK
jgi:DNA-directed RNA polymerase subunit RPC12/RpoP